VSANFFQAAGGGLVEGRLLTSADEGRRAVVSQSFARECCEGRSPVGRRAEWLGRSLEVVGVVRDVFDRALDVRPTPAMFVPLDEAQEFFWVTYLLRVERPGPELMAAVEREIQAVRADAVLTDGGVMGQRLMRSIRDRSFATVIVGFFAMVALGVSAAGIIGVVGSVVARRTREIAIRMTLGAGRAAVRRLVAQEALTASGIGAVVGLAIGAAVSSTLESLLYGVTAADPVALLLAALSIVVIVVVAAWAPARRAVRLSPTDALRIE
jgi:hypothetical protein